MDNNLGDPTSTVFFEITTLWEKGAFRNLWFIQYNMSNKQHKSTKTDGNR